MALADAVTEQIRSAPWATWVTWEYGPQNDPITLYGLRLLNTSDVPVRYKIVAGRGANTQEVFAQVVQPGEDSTTDRSTSPVNIRNVDYGITVEQV